MKNHLISISALACCLFLSIAATARAQHSPDNAATQFDGWNPTTHIDKENFYIYIVFGQSNAEGFAAAPNEEDKHPSTNLWNMIAYNNFANKDATGNDKSNVGKWENVSEPNCRKSTHFKTACSMVKAFGEEMLKRNPNKKFGFIHVSVASTSIFLFDKDKYAQYLAGQLEEKQHIEDIRAKAKYAYAGNPYQRIVELARKAQKYGTIKGILMHQGEADQWHDYWPREVKKVYTDMLTDLGLDDRQVPLLIGEPTGSHPISKKFDNVANPAHPDYIPNCYKITCRDLPFNPKNTLHFSREGYILMGQRFAVKATDLLQQATDINRVEKEGGKQNSPFVKFKEVDGNKIKAYTTRALSKVVVFNTSGAMLQSIDMKGCLAYSYLYVPIPPTINGVLAIVFHSTEGDITTIKLKK